MPSGVEQGCRGVSVPADLNSSGDCVPWDVGNGVSGWQEEGF